MKVLSLLQPWATLVVIGAKKIETRSWDTKYRGEILIHASRGTKREIQDMLCKDPFFSVLNKTGYKLFGQPGQRKKITDNLPRGAIIGKAKLVTTSTTEFFQQCSGGIPLNEKGPYNKEHWEEELAFGDYSPGRYGWLLSDPVQFEKPIPYKGELGLRDCSDDVLKQLADQLIKPVLTEREKEFVKFLADIITKRAMET